jgi:hypothetical protein
MTELSILLTAILFKTVTATLACFGIWLVVRIFDRLGKIDFTKVMNNATPDARLMYIALRLAAFSYVFATVFAYG